MKSRIVYNPTLTVAENATRNGVSVASIRKYIREKGIDRKGDQALLKSKAVRALMKEQPNITIATIAKTLGISYNTAKKYSAIDYVAIADKTKVSTFDTSRQKFLIKSVSDSQEEILNNILRLYIDSGFYDVDLTYSKGVFYKRIPQPRFKFDKYPQANDVQPLYKAYQLPVESIGSVVLDLPFLAGNGINDAKMVQRFNSFSTIEELYEANTQMLNLAYKILKPQGILVMKTMDFVHAGQQHWISIFVQNKATEIGFSLEDTFIFIAKKRLLKKTAEVQRHARKYHSYFFVFKKP